MVGTSQNKQQGGTSIPISRSNHEEDWLASSTSLLWPEHAARCRAAPTELGDVALKWQGRPATPFLQCQALQETRDGGRERATGKRERGAQVTVFTKKGRAKALGPRVFRFFLSFPFYKFLYIYIQLSMQFIFFFFHTCIFLFTIFIIRLINANNEIILKPYRYLKSISHFLIYDQPLLILEITRQPQSSRKSQINPFNYQTLQIDPFIVSETTRSFNSLKFILT